MWPWTSMTLVPFHMVPPLAPCWAAYSLNVTYPSSGGGPGGSGRLRIRYWLSEGPRGPPLALTVRASFPAHGSSVVGPCPGYLLAAVDAGSRLRPSGGSEAALWELADGLL